GEGREGETKGRRIEAARDKGGARQWSGRNDKTVDREGKGAHTGVSFSPDGNFLVTSMQENALHGWKREIKPGTEARNMR
ncbi:WD40 repeat domain-containing protein, partial [Rhizobium ruizarguesonis]